MLPKENSKTIGNGRYELIQKIGSGGMGIVYEAVDKKTNVKVALKTLKNVDPSSIFRLKIEFRSLSQIYHKNLVQLYELFNELESWYFTMELIENGKDIISFIRQANQTDPSKSLDTTRIGPFSSTSNESNSEATRIYTPNSFKNHKSHNFIPKSISLYPPCAIIDFAVFYSTIRQLCEGLSVIHKNNRLHRDLKPSNTLVTPEGRLVILDFGLVTELDTSTPKSNLVNKNSDQTTGDIMGTAAYMSPEQAGGLRLTTASDIYSIGVIIFQILTGRLPFAGDAALVIRDKQTFNSVAPSEIVRNIPPELNDLCVKMLSRDPKDRPTLEKVVKSITSGSAPIPEILTDSVRNTSIFIGRTPEIKCLIDALHSAREGCTAIVHVQGPSGSGKSTIIERFIKIATAEGSLVLSGRCYENESVPYKAIDSVIDALTDYLMQIRDDDIASILPDGISSLSKIFPVLLRIPYISQLNDVALPVIDVIQGRHIAFSCLRELLRRLSRRETLTISIDDLQWGDTESSVLISSLIQGSDPPSMVLLFSYRSDYLHRSKPLSVLSKIPETESERITRTNISVNNFNEHEIRSLSKALLPSSMQDLENHINWIVSESQGSAFFINELVRHLKSNIQNYSTTGSQLDNVIWSRALRLPQECFNILKIICVAGRPLSLRDLQYASGENSLPIQALTQLRSERFIRVEGFRWDQTTESVHDRIRESIIGRLGENQLSDINFCLATSLESNPNSDPEITAEHFYNSGRLDRASKFYFLAADKSQKLMAFERSEQLYLKALDLSQEISEKIRISEKLIHFYTDITRFQDAYRVAKDSLKLLGIKLPEKFIPPLFLLDWIKLEIKLRNKKINSLLSLKTATDINVETSIRIINSVAKAAYQIKPELCVWLSVKLVNLCLKHGNTKDCSIGYMVFGAIFKGGVLGSYQTGYDFGNLSLALVEQFKNDKQKAEVYFVVGYFGTSWMRPALHAEELWRTSFESGIITGDLFHTGCSAAGISMSLLMRGEKLDVISSKLKASLDIVNKLNLKESAGVILCVLRAIDNLKGSTKSPESFDIDGFSEAEFSNSLKSYGSRHFAHFYYIVKMQTLFLWGNFDLALTFSADGAKYAKDSTGMLHQSEYDFYKALISIEFQSRPSFTEKRNYVRKISKKFKKWSIGCPENFLPKASILSAEIYGRKNNNAAAGKQYLEAIDLSVKYGQIHVQGLSELLYANYLFRNNKLEESKFHMKAAIELMEEWGATGLSSKLKSIISDQQPSYINVEK